MPLTSNWNIWTPDDADNYDFIVDSAATAQTVDDALTDVASRANAFKGTVAERTAFTSTAVDGMLWQDTDGIKMIWRKESAAWVPAVWRWSGTTPQMNSFAAPDGFEWHNSTDGVTYTRLSSAWSANTPGIGFAPFRMAAGVHSYTMTGVNGTGTIALPPGRFTQAPIVHLSTRSNSQGVQYAASSTSTNINFLWIDGAASTPTTVQWIAIQMGPSSATG